MSQLAEQALIFGPLVILFVASMKLKQASKSYERKYITLPPIHTLRGIVTRVLLTIYLIAVVFGLIVTAGNRNNQSIIWLFVFVPIPIYLIVLLIYSIATKTDYRFRIGLLPSNSRNNKVLRLLICIIILALIVYLTFQT
jgi:glycerol uptake facilitator-like aquaporin